jgi:outer membrane protein
MKQVTKILIAAFIFFAAPKFVSAQKIAHLDYDSIIRIMPEYKIIRDSLTNHTLTLQKTIIGMQMELERKMRERDSLEGKKSPLILSLLDKEIADLNQNLNAFAQLAEEEIIDMQTRLVTPLLKKVDDAVAAVAKANGYSYVLDSSEGKGVLYSRPEDDIFLKVCTQLGITPPKPAPAGGTPAPTPK